MSTPSLQFRKLFLTHWKTYHPTMYQEMVQAGTLEAMLDSAALQLDDLLYTLVVEQQMDYSAAWEIAINQFLLPEEEAVSTSQNQSHTDQPETSA